MVEIVHLKKPDLKVDILKILLRTRPEIDQVSSCNPNILLYLFSKIFELFFVNCLHSIPEGVILGGDITVVLTLA